MKAGRKIVLGLAAVALAAGGAYWYQSRNGDGEVRYRVAKVERGPIAAVVVASGTLNAVTTVQVGSQISGQVKEIFADFNTAVKKDQVIAQIDPATFELRVNQARADLDAAEGALAVAHSGLAAQQAELGRVRVMLADAQRDFERKKSLVDKNYISGAELDKARTVLDSTGEQLKAVQAQSKVSQAQISSARAAVKQRESLLKQSQVDLERTIIRAPVDGTVILRNVDAGQTVAASLQAPVLFTIAQDLRDMQVEAAIDEADVGRLRVGMGASFAVDAFPRRNFAGEIRQIRKSPLNVQNVVSYIVVISAANPDLALLPGMTANVRVAVENRATRRGRRSESAGRRAGAAGGRPGGAGIPQPPAGGAQAERRPARAARGDLLRVAPEVRARARHEGRRLGRRRPPARGRAHPLRDQRAHRRNPHARAAPRVGAAAGRGGRARPVQRRPGVRAREFRAQAGRGTARAERRHEHRSAQRADGEPGSDHRHRRSPRLAARRRRRAAARPLLLMLIHTRDLVKVYRMGDSEIHALDHVSVDIDKGEFVAVMGPSGSGKSTFMNVLGCLDRPTSGEYVLGEKRVSELAGDDLATVRNRNIGFVFQQFNLLARTPALENVELPLVYAGMARKERSQKARAMLERVGLGERTHHHPAQLSGGQQQRVAIARALVTEPLLILADEPTGALDSRTSLEIMALLQELNQQGMTVVLVTHEPDIARFARRTLAFRDGRVVQDET